MRCLILYYTMFGQADGQPMFLGAQAGPCVQISDQILFELKIRSSVLHDS